MKSTGAATLEKPVKGHEDETFQVEMFKARSATFADHARLLGDFTKDMAARGHQVTLLLDARSPGPSPEQQTILDTQGVRLEVRKPSKRSSSSARPPSEHEQASLLAVDGTPGAVIVTTSNDDGSDTWLLHSREVAGEFEKLWQRGMLGRGILEG